MSKVQHRSPWDIDIMDDLFDDCAAAKGSSASLTAKIAAMDTAIAGKQNALTFDDAPASGSTNPVTSGGIYTALSGKATPADITSAIGALNAASVGGTGKYISSISEADGVISAVATTMDTAPTSESDNAVKSSGVYKSIKVLSNNGTKNHFNPTTLISGVPSGDCTATLSNGILSVSGSLEWSRQTYAFDLPRPGTYVFSAKITNFSSALSGKPGKIVIMEGDTSISPDSPTFNTNGTISFEFTCSTTSLSIRVYTNYTSSTSLTSYSISEIMIQDEDGIDTDYQNYAPTNKTLYDPIAELIDNSAKNLSQWNGGTAIAGNTTIASGIPFVSNGGKYVISYNTSVLTNIISIGFKDENDETVLSLQIENGKTRVAEVTIPSSVRYFNIFVNVAGTYSNFMICTKAAWDISHAFQPYRPSYQELYEMVLAIS